MQWKKHEEQKRKQWIHESLWCAMVQLKQYPARIVYTKNRNLPICVIQRSRRKKINRRRYNTSLLNRYDLLRSACQKIISHFDDSLRLRLLLFLEAKISSNINT